MIRFTPSTGATRRAFTLVELLVAITIIGILMGIAIPAITAALRTARESSVRTEVETLSQAIEAYKLKYGDYPPDFFDWNVVVRHYRKAFPDIATEELAILRDQCANRHDVNQGATGTSLRHDPYRIDRAEALVWNLGGFSSDPQRPFTGPGGPLQLKTTLANATRITHYGNYAYNGTRDNALFDFDLARLTIGEYNTGLLTALSTEEPTNQPATSETQQGNDYVDIFPVFLRETGRSPYVYFDSRTYGSEDHTAPNAGDSVNHYEPPAGNGWGGLRPYLSDQRVAPTERTVQLAGGGGLQFMNNNTFQIMHGGLDDIFGVILRDNSSPERPVYFAYPSGQAYVINGATAPPTAIEYLGKGYQETSDASVGAASNFHLDNLTNFAPGRLDSNLP
jgi:prepilin-type N-terminal cleavage/methylation domain-containing protein